MEFSQLLSLLGSGALETLYMVILSTACSYLVGIPLGVLLFITDKKGICPCRILNWILGVIVNLTRSIPFIILLIAILPFTRLVAGTTIGTSEVVLV